MQSKQGIDLSVTPLSILFAPNEVTVASGNKIINSSFIQEFLCKVGVCSFCHLAKLELRQNKKGKDSVKH